MIPSSLRKSTALSVPTSPVKPPEKRVDAIPIEPLDSDPEVDKDIEEIAPEDSDEENKEIDIVENSSGEETIDSDEEKPKATRRILFKKTVYWFKPEPAITRAKKPPLVVGKVTTTLKPVPKKSKSTAKPTTSKK